MTEAPEKIWAVEGLSEILSFNTYDNGGLSYTRTDVALARINEVETHYRAMVAAAYEAAAAFVLCDIEVVIAEEGERSAAVFSLRNDAKNIRALTDADAQDALERVKREARNEARREALEAVSGAAWKHGGDDAFSRAIDNVARKQNDEDYKAILAQMEDTEDE